MVCLAQTMVLPCRPFHTRAPRQRPSSVSRSSVNVFSQISTFSDCSTRRIMTRMISLPVASPSAWTMRSWLCPPSRPSASRPPCVVELRAPVDQFADPQGGLAHHVLDHRRIAERAAGFERVGHVVLDAVVRVHDRGHSALSVVAIGLPNRLLGDDHDREPGIDGQRRPQTGQPAADHQHVGKEVRHALGMERDQVSRDRCGHGWRG